MLLSSCLVSIVSGADQFPWPSMTGWCCFGRFGSCRIAWGNCLGGTFGGNCFEKAKVVEASWQGLALQVLRKPVQFLASCAANCDRGGFLFGVFSSSATSSPFSHRTGCELSAQCRLRQRVVKRNVDFYVGGYPLSFRNQSPRELERSPVNKFPTVPRACLSTWCRPRGVR